VDNIHAEVQQRYFEALSFFFLTLVSPPALATMFFTAIVLVFHASLPQLSGTIRRFILNFRSFAFLIKFI